MQSSISDVKAWATANMLKLNDSKTDLMLVTSKRSKHLHNLPTSITIGNAQIPFKQSVKNLGFTLDCHLTMNALVSNIARTCYFELRRLASFRRFLTSTATATLVSAFVLSRTDYCNSLLFGSTHDVTYHVQRIQNYAARVILRLPKSSSITIHLKSLHWLPVKVRSTYKIACLCNHCHSSTAPSYVTGMLHRKPLHTRNTRRSSETALLKVVNDLFLSLNKGNISVLALLDFSSAFDTIDHTILVHRLHTDFGFTDTVLQWFSSYLTDRIHYVSLSNHCSAFVPVHSGVPQCSVLGPILFTMYTKPLSAIIDSHSIIHHSFADDLQLHMSAPPDRISELLHSMQSCISDVKA